MNSFLLGCTDMNIRVFKIFQYISFNFLNKLFQEVLIELFYE